jgi:hypothetical protein
MRAGKILLQQFAADLYDVHRSRLRVVFAAAQALLKSGRLSLTSLGRAISDQNAAKHGIKKMDRLLGNESLHRERNLFFHAIAKRVVGRVAHPVVLVDWTAFTPTLWVLVAAVSFEGRALVVYAETHPIANYMKPFVNVEFLRRLKDVLPRACRPILVADAGFRAPWMRLVEKMGWDYVVRIRGPVKIRRTYGRGWVLARFLFGLTRSVPVDFGHIEIGKRGRYVSRLVGISKRGPSSAPKDAVPAYHREGCARKHRREAREPWLLATSLEHPASGVIAIYARRMQIEQTFRDNKSPRFGVSLSHARTNSVERANVLLLLAALVHLVAVLVGMAAEAARLHLREQANTLIRRRVLSLPMLGRLVLARGNDRLLRAAISRAGWRTLQSGVALAAR